VLVNTLAGSVVELSPLRRTLAKGLGALHGLAAAPDGSLAVSELDADVIVRIRDRAQR
jgi:streptogramin lyase